METEKKSKNLTFFFRNLRKITKVTAQIFRESLSIADAANRAFTSFLEHQT